MKNTLTQRIVLAIFALFLLAYVGFQTYRFINSRYDTETAFLYTVSETAQITGIALRNEVIIEDEIGSGVAVYMVGDGDKVSINSEIAEIFHDKSDAQETAQLRNLSKKKKLLEKAQDPGTTSFAHTDILNKQIFNEVGNVVDSVNANSLLELSTISDNLLVLMNTKQIATGQQDNFQDAIDQIDAQQSYCLENISENRQTVKSPQPGYFIRTIDGYEDAIDLSKIDEIDANKLFDLLNNTSKQLEQKDHEKIGKLMIGHNWYFAAVIPEEEINKYRIGKSVTLDFNISGIDPVSASIYKVNLDKENGNVVIFQCDYINEPLVNLRIAQADVQFKSITGLRVSDQAIRFIGMQKGVYTLVGEKLVFRPVTVIYEDIGFVLCKENDIEYDNDPSFGRGLQQFDEVITKGMNLYDNKQVG